MHKKLFFFRPQVRDESEASPPTLPTSQRPPLCDQLSHIFSTSNFRSQACAPNRPGGALFPMAPAELGASWTFEVSHVSSDVSLIRKSRFNVFSHQYSTCIGVASAMFDTRKSGTAPLSDKKNPRLRLRSRHKAHLKTSRFTAQWERF